MGEGVERAGWNLPRPEEWDHENLSGVGDERRAAMEQYIGDGQAILMDKLGVDSDELSVEQRRDLLKAMQGSFAPFLSPDQADAARATLAHGLGEDEDSDDDMRVEKPMEDYQSDGRQVLLDKLKVEAENQTVEERREMFQSLRGSFAPLTMPEDSPEFDAALSRRLQEDVGANLAEYNLADHAKMELFVIILTQLEASAERKKEAGQQLKEKIMTYLEENRREVDASIFDLSAAKKKEEA